MVAARLEGHQTNDDLTLTIPEIIDSLARGDNSDVEAFFCPLEFAKSIEDCRVSFSAFHIAIDANGRTVMARLMDFMLHSILDYAIPRSAIEAAHNEYEKSKSTSKITRLHEQARRLFTPVATSGEGGELLLFLFAERVLGLPQIMCKMDLKTSGSMHFHGIDGIHIGPGNAPGELALYWGESKMHATYSAAINNCFSDISKYLLADGSLKAATARDLQLLQRKIQLSSKDLDDALAAFFDPDNVAFNSVEFRGVCLIGFDASDYPAPSEQRAEAAVHASLLTNVEKWKSSLSRAAKTHGISSIHIDAFCVPVPSADRFRDEFRGHLGLTNGA